MKALVMTLSQLQWDVNHYNYSVKELKGADIDSLTIDESIAFQKKLDTVHKLGVALKPYTKPKSNENSKH